MHFGRLPSWLYSVIAVFPAVALAGVSASWGSPGREIALTATVLWSVAFVLAAWFRLDEPSREAHKFAWFWGSLALPLLLLACLLPGLPTLARVYVEDFIARNPETPWRPTSLAFVAGVAAAALVQLAGWALVWTGWWLSKRR